MEITKKKCPVCQAKIEVGLWTIRENIRQCPQCKTLLMENPVSKLVSATAFFSGGFMAAGGKWLGIPLSLSLLLMIVSLVVAIKIIRFNIVKRDLIIRNKTTNQISFITMDDWEEIEKNSQMKNESHFEIVEYLKNETETEL
jgi:hypothetical protein